MKTRWLGALSATTVAVAIAIGLASAQAQAKPGYFLFPAYRESSFTVKGTNGFAIAVTHTGHRVELHASDGDAAAIYIVPAPKPSGDGAIEATFPGLGRVSVRFNPSGSPRRSPPFYPPECTGGGEITQRGTFSGTVMFRGEQGFTRVTVEHARGVVRRSFKEVCRQSGGDSGPQPEPVYTLVAYAKSHGRTVGFNAVQSTSNPSTTWFFASVAEKRKSMRLVKLAFVDAHLDAFTVAGPLARPDTASVAPPPPITGAATFHGTLDGEAEWEGHVGGRPTRCGRCQARGALFLLVALLRTTLHGPTGE